MNKKALFEKSKQLREQAEQIIADTNVVDIWHGIGAEINLVGSIAMDLMMNHRDIDYHIYTDPFVLSDSFNAIALLAEHPRIRSITYTNLLDAEDSCVEWHATYEDDNGKNWMIDMIHILRDSPYAGYFERVAQKIKEQLTDETRAAILDIKHSIPEGRKVMGIRIYRAVLEGGVKDLNDFYNWEEQHPVEGIEDWIPE